MDKELYGKVIIIMDNGDRYTIFSSDPVYTKKELDEFVEQIVLVQNTISISTMSLLTSKIMGWEVQ